MLILFDIDGTLLRTEGAGISAMLNAARELFPANAFSFEKISLSGRLDPLIWKDLMTSAGIDASPEMHAVFRARYGHYLQVGFDANSRSHALPGARTLVAALHAHEECDLGLLTGNYEHTGRLKVVQAGFSLEPFQFNAWADDGVHRRDLPPIALRRHAASHGREIDPSRIVILGDTPLDIDCAHFNGCQVIAVATGAHPEGELREHNPDLLVSSLENWQEILSWITSR